MGDNVDVVVDDDAVTSIGEDDDDDATIIVITTTITAENRFQKVSPQRSTILSRLCENDMISFSLSFFPPVSKVPEYKVGVNNYTK